VGTNILDNESLLCYIGKRIQTFVYFVSTTLYLTGK